jgi:hypothetical protein
VSVLPLLVAAIAAAPASPSAPGGGRAPALQVAPSPDGGARAPGSRLQDAWEEDQGWEDDGDEERQRRIRIIAWGGEALGEAGTGRGSPTVGGEAAWAFDSLDVGVSGAAYRELEGATRTWTPVVLARLTQRFRMGSGLEAAFGLGVGAGRPAGWTGWFQVALGVRVPLGPLFLAGELAFEERELLRLGAGLGVALW